MGRYQSESANYGLKVSSSTEILDDVFSDLSSIEEEFGIDPDTTQDMLTYNVITSNSEIKSEVEDLTNLLNSYKSLIASRAYILDEEEKDLSVDDESME